MLYVQHARGVSCPGDAASLYCVWHALPKLGPISTRSVKSCSAECVTLPFSSWVSLHFVLQQTDMSISHALPLQAGFVVPATSGARSHNSWVPQSPCRKPSHRSMKMVIMDPTPSVSSAIAAVNVKPSRHDTGE